MKFSKNHTMLKYDYKHFFPVLLPSLQPLPYEAKNLRFVSENTSVKAGSYI